MTPRRSKKPEEETYFSKDVFSSQRAGEDGNPIDPSPSDGEEIKQAGNSSCLSRIESRSLQAALGKTRDSAKKKRKAFFD